MQSSFISSLDKVTFVKVLYSRVPHPFGSGKASVLWLFVMFAASTLVRQSGDQRGVGWGRCHRSVVAVTAEVRSLSTSSEEWEHHLCTSDGLEVLLQGEAYHISCLMSHALESISRSFLLLRKRLGLFFWFGFFSHLKFLHKVYGFSTETF